jgi:hypothetical protein
MSMADRPKRSRVRGWRRQGRVVGDGHRNAGATAGQRYGIAQAGAKTPGTLAVLEASRGPIRSGQRRVAGARRANSSAGEQGRTPLHGAQHRLLLTNGRCVASFATARVAPEPRVERKQHRIRANRAGGLWEVVTKPAFNQFSWRSAHRIEGRTSSQLVKPSSRRVSPMGAKPWRAYQPSRSTFVDSSAHGASEVCRQPLRSSVPSPDPGGRGARRWRAANGRLPARRGWRARKRVAGPAAGGCGGSGGPCETGP